MDHVREKPAMDNVQVVNNYFKDGFCGGIKVFSPDSADHHRRELEQAEKKLGSLHYVNKIHTILRSSYEIATHPELVNAVEAILGPDMLLYNSTYIIKEPNTESFVSWHQDLTYWGFDSDDLVSAWVALTPATKESGCMKMIASSYQRGMSTHVLTDDTNNVLFLGQTIEDVEKDSIVICPLAPGEASLHHGWTIHSSEPNRSMGRRIGLNIQYIKPSMRQKSTQKDSAMLIRGEDRYQYFETDSEPPNELAVDAKEQMARLTERHERITTNESQQ